MTRLDRVPARYLTAVLVVVSSALYAPSIGNDFHYDDFHSIVHNPNIRALAEVPAFFMDPSRFSSNPQSAMYRPVLMAAFAANYAADGLRPAGYHFVNVALHSCNVVLVQWLGLALGLGASVAAVGAFLFAVNPLHSEAVNYVSIRSELLMAFFFLAACCAHLRFARTRALSWYALALALSLFAICSKSVAVTLAIALPLCDAYLQGREAVLSRWRIYAGYGVVALSYVAVSRQVIDRALLEPVRGLDVQLFTQLKGIAYYATLVIVPVRLSPEHQFFVSRSLDGTVVAAAALVASTLLLAVLARRGKTFRLAVTWSAVVLAPSLVVPLIVLVNEHRLYPPGAVLALAAALAFADFCRRHNGVAASGVALYTCLFVALTLQRGPSWSDELSLWSDAAAKAPLMVKPHLRLADAQSAAGLRAEAEATSRADVQFAAGLIAEAEASYQVALSLRPQHVAARNNLGRLYLREGRLEEAEAHFRVLLATSPDHVAARLNLASTQLRSGRWQDAQREYQTSLRYGHTGGRAQGQLGRIALGYGGDPKLAVRYLSEAIELSPTREHPDLLVSRGVALKALGRVEESEADYASALRLAACGESR